MDTVRLIELAESGKTHAEIAKTLGVTRPTVSAKLKKLGIKQNKQPKVDINKLREAVETGTSFSQFASQNRCSLATVSKIAKAQGIQSKTSTALREDLPIAEIYAKQQAGTSLNKLMKQYKTPIATLKRVLKRYYPGIKFKTTAEQIRPALLNDKQALAEASKTSSYRSIARQLGVKTKTVTNAAKRFGLEFSFHTIWGDIGEDELYTKYVMDAKNPSQIAGEMNYPYLVVLRQLHKAGFEINEPGSKPRPSKYPQLNDKGWMESKYSTSSAQSMAAEIGCTAGMVLHHLRKHGVVIKSRTEVLDAILDHRHGIKHTYKGIKCHSDQELEFLKTTKESDTIEPNINLNSDDSYCSIDFKVNGELVEVKSKDVLTKTGPDRRRMIKQVMICKRNNLDLKVWTKAGYWDGNICDDDILHAMNWKLFFDDSDKCFEWLVGRGFEAPRYGCLELVDASIRMLACKPGEEFNANWNNGQPAKITHHYFPHFWRSTREGYNAISDAWEQGNQIVLKNAITRLWSEKKDPNIYSLLKTISKHYREFTTVSVFKPWIARAVYNKFIGNNGVVIDPCCGWGGRLMGTANSDIAYIGCDLNPMGIESHIKLAGFLGSKLRHKPEFRLIDSSRDQIPEGDLLFTSPPYDSTEVYFGTPPGTKTISIVDNVFDQFKGIVVLNIPKWVERDTVEAAARHGRSLSEKLEMKTASVMGREKTHEPILVFK